ncbi:MAG: hypothetical protein AAF492_06715, partial [Verrucomicrobiota bacterium]
LMAAIRIAPQLGAYALKDQLLKAMSQRFAGNATAIAFRRKLIGSARMDIVFSGTFERPDGTSLSFPFDRMGHPYLAVFWSKDSDLAIEKLKQLKEQQQERPDVFEIYSFNLDELPDAGGSILQSIGLTCTALKLPGGRQSETFRTYGVHEPAALRVNHLGHAIVPPSQSVHFKSKEEAKAFSHAAVYDEFAYPEQEGRGHLTGYDEYDRHLSQIQSLLIGDLLATGETISKAPHRYRLREEEALAKYEKAGTAIAETPAPWRVRNQRMIALMGTANLRGSPEHFQEAVEEARAVAALELPVEAKTVARFCLAKDALRQGRESPRKILKTFVEDCGGDEAGLDATSAAAILAIHADARELYQHYRSRILAAPEHPQHLAPFVAFLQDRYHQYYLFRGNPLFYLYSREYRFAERRYMIDDGLTPITRPLPPFDVKTLDGTTISLPNTNSEVLTLLLFVEPDGNRPELAPEIYAPPVEPTKRNKNPTPTGLLASAYALEAANINNGLRCITIFLSDDATTIKAIRDKYSLPGLITVLPDGLNHPAVNRLGILSADRNVNSILVRRDGTIAWNKNGLPYQMSGKLSYISTIGWNAHINVCDVEAGFRALRKKDFNQALQLFSGTYLRKTEAGREPELTADLLRGRREVDHKWKSSRFHGSALAHVGLKQYEAGMKQIEAAIADYLKRFNHDIEKPSTTMIHLLTTKARILDGLGRRSEARAARNQAAVEPTDYPTYYSRIRGFNEPYEAFENRLSIIAKEIE